MVVRFFFLQAHYRSTLDITDDGLQAAEKGYKRLMEANKILHNLISENNSLIISELDKEITALMDAADDDMNDDFNAPKALSRLFELATIINSVKGGQLKLSEITEGVLSRLKKTFNDFIFQIFGLKYESAIENGHETLDGLMKLILDIRQNARVNKDWTTSDKIRDGLKEAKISLKDGKDGTSWLKE